MKSSRLIFAAIVLIVMLLALNEYLTHKESAQKSAQNNAAAKKLLDVPIIRQMDAPRLYNGCEVTSLAMLLVDNGFHVTKNQLAEEIKYVPFT